MDEDIEYDLKECTPYQLLAIKQAAYMIMRNAPSTDLAYKIARDQVNAVDYELVRRGRCTLCGLKHLTVYHQQDTRNRIED